MSKKFFSLLLGAAFVMIFAAVGVSAQRSVQRVKFAKGATGATFSNVVRGYEFRDYIVKAGAGQTLSVKIKSPNNYLVFTIFDPQGNNLEGNAEMDDFTSAALPATGEYKVRVLMMRAGARRKNSAASYTLRISIQ